MLKIRNLEFLKKHRLERKNKRSLFLALLEKNLMNEKAFERLVKEAVKEIPQEFLEKLENVTILVEDFPTHYQIEKLKERNLRGFLLGLYEGVPQIRRGRYGIGGQIPDKITIFRRPILAIARDVEHLKEIIKDTVIHEIAHHFGFSEEQIKKAKR